VAAVVLLLFSVGYAAMSRHVVDAGAFYAYVTKGLGAPVGVGSAGLALLTYTAIQAGLYGLAGATAQGLVVQYGGPDLPWWVWAFVLMALVALLGYRSIDVGTKVLGVLLTLEIAVIAVVAVAVLVQGGADGIEFSSFTPSAFFSGAPGISIMFAMFAALLAFHNAVSRYLFALGRERRAPAGLGRTHARHGSPHVGSLTQTASAAVIVAVFALAGSDPVLQLFTWMSGLATVSILVLMVLTSLAVLAFFARTRVDGRVWHTRVAPVLGTLGLVGVTILVLSNFTTLISGDAVLATVLLVVIALAFAGGVAVAVAQRSRRAPAGDALR